ncbi:hypothetical protein [Burkholderia cepacia]|uniref:hypothetical protein n=1 Tax=Burkholderia cepacia TaxID=292 RepID=UPI002AB7F125|nr:hypothetical protein [Burkholderia cepacia]
MTVSSEGRKVPSCGWRVESARFWVTVLPAGGRTPRPVRARAGPSGASGSFCHVDICAFMPITDLIDSAFESIGRDARGAAGRRCRRAIRARSRGRPAAAGFVGHVSLDYVLASVRGTATPALALKN